YSSFFFSSRRRHTRFSRDWSSDVCSSDLAAAESSGPSPEGRSLRGPTSVPSGADVGPRRLRPSGDGPLLSAAAAVALSDRICIRSEERRVGEESRARCATAPWKEKETTI